MVVENRESLLRAGLSLFHLIPVLKLLALQRVGVLQNSPRRLRADGVAAASLGDSSLVL